MDMIRPTTQPRRQDVIHPPHPTSAKNKRMKVIGSIAAGMIFLTLLVVVVWQVLRPSAQPLNPNQYQVVYLAGGQMFFGKLQNTDGEYLYMKSPYTAQSSPQAAADEKSKAIEQTTTLLKVKDQLYGPEDMVAIKSTQVVFWQNLRDDSKVTQAIKSKQ